MLNIFKVFRRNRNANIEYAIRFVNKQKKLNNRNIKILDKLGYDTNELKEWNEIYSFINKNLKRLRKE